MYSLIGVGRELAAEVGLDSLLHKMLAKAGELTDSPDASVILKHEGRPGLYVAAANGEKSEWVLLTFGRYSAKAIPIEGSKAGQVFQTGRSIVENTVQGYFEGVDAETKKVTESMVCAPLCIGDRTIGVMQILNKRGGLYENRDRAILEHLASHAAVAIQNALLFESLVAHSGLYTECKTTAELAALVAELHDAPRQEVLTILFADMRGFTQLCQALGSAEEVQRRLNEFISMLAEEIINQNGLVNKFLGDGVMALFRKERHAERAVRAAFKIVDEFHTMRQRWDDESSQQLNFLNVGVGIVTGEVTLGPVGTSRVRDFTAIGTAVNLAAAFERKRGVESGLSLIRSHIVALEMMLKPKFLMTTS